MSWGVTDRFPSSACDSAYHRPLSGYVFVDLNSEDDVKKALKCNREYMGEGAWDTSAGRP